MKSKRRSHNPIWLRDRGYDGLCVVPVGTDGCGCSVDDFAPCNEGPYPECVPAEQSDDRLFYKAKRKRRAEAQTPTI